MNVFASLTSSIHKIQEIWIISGALRTLVIASFYGACNARKTKGCRISEAPAELASSQSITFEREEEKNRRRRYMGEREKDG